MKAHRRRVQLGILLAGCLAILLGLWATRAPDLAGAALCLSPGMFVFLLLWLGHYPGEKTILTLIAGSRRRRPHLPPAGRHRRRPRTELPRGGALLGNGLAGRAPPLGGGLY
jgi:hypothetical protein